MEYKTERLTLIPLNAMQLNLLTEDMPRFEREMDVTYRGEPIEGHLSDVMKEQYLKLLDNKDEYEWYTFWQFKLNSENTIIGNACFKGAPDKNGEVEIGYGINALYRNKGYTTEAVAELCKWALKQKGAACVIAETEKDNIASQRVLLKCGMKQYKETGESFWYNLK